MNKTAREPKPRARSGCNTCRKRRLRCDETRPVCLRCISSRFSCDYHLRLIWEEDALSKGKCHGRAGVWSKGQTSATYQGVSRSSVRIRSELDTSLRELDAIKKRECREIFHVFLNTTSEDMKLYYMISDAENALGQQSSNRLSTYNLLKGWSPLSPARENHFSFSYLGDPQRPLSTFPSNPGISENERTLLNYYKSVICADVTHIRRDDEHDPRKFFLCLATDSRVVYLGVLMSSACFLKEKDSRFAIIALEYRQTVLNVLRGLLKMIETHAPEIILLAIMLCSSEIRNGCDPAWVTHFAVFSDMILRYRRKLDHGYRNKYPYRLGWRYLGYHLVIAKTVFPIETLIASNESIGDSSWTSTQNLSLIMSPDTMDLIDSYSGISNRLLLLINDIADLKKHLASRSTERCGIKGEEELIIENIKRIHESLSNLQQIVPYFIQTTSPEWVENIRKTAEATRLAALILLHETLKPSLFDSMSKIVPAYALNSRSFIYNSILDHHDRRKYVDSVLILVREVIDNGPLSVSWPLWALFIAGCCTKDEENRISVLNLFERALAKSNIGNIKPAFNVVKAVWNQLELEVDDEVCTRTKRRRLKRDASLYDADRYRGWYGWGKVMDMMGLKVSLA